jgi:hypothetical protein
MSPTKLLNSRKRRIYIFIIYKIIRLFPFYIKTFFYFKTKSTLNAEKQNLITFSNEKNYLLFFIIFKQKIQW